MGDKGLHTQTMGFRKEGDARNLQGLRLGWGAEHTREGSTLCVKFTVDTGLTDQCGLSVKRHRCSLNECETLHRSLRSLPRSRKSVLVESPAPWTAGRSQDAKASLSWGTSHQKLFGECPSRVTPRAYCRFIRSSAGQTSPVGPPTPFDHFDKGFSVKASGFL